MTFEITLPAVCRINERMTLTDPADNGYGHRVEIESDVRPLTHKFRIQTTGQDKKRELSLSFVFTRTLRDMAIAQGWFAGSITHSTLSITRLLWRVQRCAVLLWRISI